MTSPVKTLLGKFSATSVSRKSVDEQFKLLLESVKGEDLTHLANETVNVIKGKDIKDPTYLQLQNQLVKSVQGFKFPHVSAAELSTIPDFAKSVIKHIETYIIPDLQYEINSRLSDDNYVSAMKYDTFFVIRLTELCDFVINYSSMLLHYTLKTATDEVLASKGQPVIETNKIFIKRLNHYVFQYAGVCECLLRIDSLRKQFQTIPPTLISSDEISDFRPTSGNTSDVDPFRMGFISVAWNPAYYIGRAIAEWQHNKYREQQERAKVIRIRLNYLKGVGSDRPDPNSERRIALLEADLSKLEYAVLKYEESLWDTGD